MTQPTLAIDDSPTMRVLISQALGSHTFNVSVAEDGMAGLERLAEVGPHLVITDINMPGLDGFVATEGVRRNPQHACPPMRVLTTESCANLKERARRTGETGCIVKPFDEVALISVIKRVLEV